MQRFERSREPPPPVFKSREADRNRIALRDFLRTDIRKRAQTKVPQTTLSLKDGSITDALARLFRFKCAFCEMRVQTAPYRFRPPGDARPFVASEIGHLYYIWLADAWENIYPICDICRPREADYFPVKGDRAPLPSDGQLDRYVEEAIGLWRDHPQEKALLLDPCGTGELYSHFHVEMSGRFIARTAAAAATIDHFKLNHPTRVAARHKQFGYRFGRLHLGPDKSRKPPSAERSFRLHRDRIRWQLVSVTPAPCRGDACAWHAEDEHFTQWYCGRLPPAFWTP